MDNVTIAYQYRRGDVRTRARESDLRTAVPTYIGPHMVCCERTGDVLDHYESGPTHVLVFVEVRDADERRVELCDVVPQSPLHLIKRHLFRSVSHDAIVGKFAITR